MELKNKVKCLKKETKIVSSIYNVLANRKVKTNLNFMFENLFIYK